MNRFTPLLDRFIELVREHEDAHVRHAEAVAATKGPFPSDNVRPERAAQEAMLRAGSMASMTGGRLSAFVEGALLAVASGEGTAHD